MSVELNRARVILERTAGKVPAAYRDLPGDQFQAQILIDLGYHEILGTNEETYKQELPRLTHQPKSLSRFYTPLIIDPRIDIDEVFRRAYISDTLHVTPEHFKDIEPEPTSPYIAWFRPGDMFTARPEQNRRIVFDDLERATRIREDATFVLMAPLLGLKHSSLVAAGSLYQGVEGIYAAISSQPDRPDVFKISLECTRYGISSCVKDSKLIPIDSDVPAI